MIGILSVLIICEQVCLVFCFHPSLVARSDFRIDLVYLYVNGAACQPELLIERIKRLDYSFLCGVEVGIVGIPCLVSNREKQTNWEINLSIVKKKSNSFHFIWNGKFGHREVQKCRVTKRRENELILIENIYGNWIEKLNWNLFQLSQSTVCSKA